MHSRTNKSGRDDSWDKHCWLIGGVGSVLLAGVEPEIYKFTATQGFAWSAALVTCWAGAWSGVLPIYLSWKAKRQSFLWAAMPVFLCGMPLGMHHHTSFMSTAQTAGILLTLSVTMWAIGMGIRYIMRRPLTFPQALPQPTAAVKTQPDSNIWPPPPLGK